MSANTSKPSNVHPRFEATSAFHCAPLSARYHGEDPKVSTSLMISSRSLPRHIPPEIAHEKLTLISRALGRAHPAPCSGSTDASLRYSHFAGTYSFGSTCSPNNSTVRTGSQARLTVSISLACDPVRTVELF